MPATDGTPDALPSWSESAIAARPGLVSAARRVVRDRGEAEDVADEAIARLAAAVEDGERIEAVTGWLHRTALRIAVDRARAWIRRNRPAWRHDVAARPEPPDPARALEGAELRERLWRAVLDLPERQRECVVLRQMEGLPYREVAARLGVAATTVRGHVHAARAALRSALWDLAPGRAPDRAPKRRTEEHDGERGESER